jgi:hypothetical protein
VKRDPDIKIPISATGNPNLFLKVHSIPENGFLMEREPDIHPPQMIECRTGTGQGE